jgi:Putative DNA-binding domain
MDKTLFERLLYEEESTTLDFKRDQYPFAKASEDEKSKLLKDILGFANAWRRSEAYILIGVQEVRGGRSIVVGIPLADHIDDHSLQQFVNNLTNQPVRFHYEAFGFEGKQVGIIRIDLQTRPLYLKRDYGILAKNSVYVRHGSSTDPTKPASPEEIAQMRVGSIEPDAEILVQFADLQSDTSLGDKITWDAELCEMPAIESIPDFEGPGQPYAFGIGLSVVRFDPFNQLNPDYYRQLAHYDFVRRLARPVRLLFTNVGQAPVKNAHAELVVPATAGVTIMEPSDFPDMPEPKAEIINSAAMKGIRPALRRDPGEVTIDRNDQRFKIEIDCGDLQPDRSIKSDELFILKSSSGEMSLTGHVLAENLPDPKDFTLVISANIQKTTMTLEDLMNLAQSMNTND